MPRVILGIKLYSTAETAELLGVTRGTITKYIHAKKLPYQLIGGKKYFSEQNIKAFLQASGY